VDTPAPSFELRFQCTGCGRCCTGRGEHFIEATRAEQERIRAFLGVTWRWFRRRYVTAYADGTEGLHWDGDRCAFLNGARCRIYAVRPAQCRHYPFWPEVVRSPGAWAREGHRCEGIGRGDAVAVSRVTAALRAQRTKR